MNFVKNVKKKKQQKKQKKLVKMADSSPCGQNTVKNYISNSLADDSDD